MASIWRRAGSAIKKGLFGEEGKLPATYLEAQQNIADLAEMQRQELDAARAARAAGQRTALGQAIERGGTRAARTAQSQLQEQAMAATAGARGLGSLGLQRAAQSGAIREGARAAGQILGGAAERADLAEIQREQSLFGSLLEIEQMRAQQALLEEEAKKAAADPGLWGPLLAAGGAAIGGGYGGPEGAKVGAQIGYGLGETTSPYLR